MLKQIKFLLDNDENQSRGNYTVKTKRNTAKLYYHMNKIAIINFDNNHFKLNDCGYGKFSSTTRALSSVFEYMKQYTDKAKLIKINNIDCNINTTDYDRYVDVRNKLQKSA